MPSIHNSMPTKLQMNTILRMTRGIEFTFVDDEYNEKCTVANADWDIGLTIVDQDGDMRYCKDLANCADNPNGSLEFHLNQMLNLATAVLSGKREIILEDYIPLKQLSAGSCPFV